MGGKGKYIFDAKPKGSRCENKRIGQKVEVTTCYFSATAGASTKRYFDSSMLKPHLKATMKFEQTVDCFKRYRKNKNKVDQSKHYKYF